MADFSAEDLVDLAKKRYGAAILRTRMRGAGGDATLADAELLAIATSVFSRVKVAASAQNSWPFSALYAEAWPENLLQNAMDLFNWRTLSGLDSASENQRLVGKAAEDYFQKVQSGAIPLGVGGDRDTSTPTPVAARGRDGSSNLTGIPDRENTLDAFRGLGWDYWS